ncbi:MAG TPA: HEAT repeat domain-containing protein, partial [Blastocatellia bacterium]|nr:HEAT repeat domain-containing protein [Blastocatellia bacterium]
MSSLRPLMIIAAFLMISVSIPQSLFSQHATKPSQPKRPAPQQRQTKRSQRAGSLAPAINELLKLDPLAAESPGEKDSGNASASLEEEDKPPADDAPIKELIAYWSQDHDADAPKPSDKVRQRLLEMCETRPELTPNLADFLPDTTDTHDRLYKLLEEEHGSELHWKSFLQDWLRRNSRYFRDDLIAAARATDDRAPDAGDDLKALARLDWDAARPILESLASGGKAFVTPLALSLLYEHAMQLGDSANAESYRALLKAIASNRHANWSARAEVLTTLMKTDWNGQEEWLVSLFADPTLSNFPAGEIEGDAESKDESRAKTGDMKGAIGIEGLQAPSDVGFGRGLKSDILATALHGNIDKWHPVANDLVGHSHRTVRRSAVKCLASFLNQKSCDEKRKKEIARTLAPCLTEPGWAAAEDRLSFIQSLVDLKAPELLSGLIWVLEHDEDHDNRAAAAEAVTQYRDARAIPALRRALENEKGEGFRDKIVTTLAECGGFSDEEMAAAIEAYAKAVVTAGSEQEFNLAEAGDPEKPLPLKVSLGRILHKSETIQATEGMAIRLFERAKALRASQPAVARQILRSIEGAPLRVAEINLVERIGEGWADVDALTHALENRDSIQKSAADELYSLIKQGGYAAGLAATILNDEREQREALGGFDAKAQLALLAGARYLRDKLPVELVNKLLDSTNRALSKAAESYLEVEDSAEARKLVLARHRGEAYILGEGAAIGRETSGKWEEAMRKEIKGGAGLEAIYAVARPDSHPDFAGVVIRVRNGKAEISLYETEGRRNVRMLTESEFEELRSFTSRQEVEDLGPESYDDDTGRTSYEYLRLTKDGGRRIVLDGLRRAPKNPTLHEELSALFYRLSRSGDFTTRYEIEDKIPGVEVLLADNKQEALMVCGEGREIRVLIGEKGADYTRGLAEAMPEWREFSSGKPGGVTEDPRACRMLS